MSARSRVAVVLLGLGAALPTCGEPPVAGPRVYALDLAEEIPMTGSPQPLFSELDVVARQFLKWRCGGAAVVAVAYRGRRVYKRGFGRMHGRANEEVLLGCPEDSLDPFVPESPLVQPDTPLLIGSLSKPITAAVARWLVDERARERGVQMPPCEGDFCSCDEPPCPATAADIPILHPQMDLLPEHIAEVMRGDVPLPVADPEHGPCLEGADPEYADPRWADVTLGQLISHQSGLPRGAVSWSDPSKGVIANIAALRGYDSPDEAVWQHEYDVLRAESPEYLDAMEESRAWLTGLHGGAPVYFVNKGNAVAGHRLWDEHLLLSLNQCHDYNPGPDNYYNHHEGLYHAIDTSGSYSNLAYDIVGRINDHVQEARTGHHYMAEYGDLETHWGSALEEYFRTELGIEGGVETPEGIFNYQLTSQYRAPQDHPTPRFRETDEAYNETKSLHRPYCVMSDGECSFAPWVSGRYSGANVRAPYDFAPPQDPSAGFEEVPAWRHNHSGTSAAGGIVVEAPVYLRFARDHRISGTAYEVDNGNGAPRDWTRDGGHAGSLGGGRAYISQLKNEPRLVALPPLIDGHLVDEFVHTRSRLVSIPDDVDFFVAINQREDPRCVKEPWEDSACSYEYGTMLHRFILFALDEVDWDAVAAQVEAQAETIVAMVVDPQGVAHYWYADDMHLDSGGEPESFEGRAALVEGLPPDSAALASYRLPSTRIGPDVLGIATDEEGVVHAWYTDGRVSTGTARDLSATAEPVRFGAAPEPSLYDITAIAIDSGGVVHTWYADGTRAEGSVTELAAGGLSSYAVPQGYAHSELVTATIERGAGPDGADRVWARYTDGYVSSGTVDDLGAYD